MNDEKKEGTVKKLQGLAAIAEKLECTQTQLAIAWTVISKDVTTVLLGASKIAQIEENVAALDVVEKLTPEILKEIDDLLGNKIATEMDMKTWTPIPPRR